MSSSKRSVLFATFIGNLGSHTGTLRIEKGTVRMTPCFGMDAVTYRIDQKGATADVWDSTYLVDADGKEHWLGNRCAAVADYTGRVAKALWAWAEIRDAEVSW